MLYYYNIAKIQKYKLSSDLNGYELWLVLCPAKVRSSKKKKNEETTSSDDSVEISASDKVSMSQQDHKLVR